MITYSATKMAMEAKNDYELRMLRTENENLRGQVKAYQKSIRIMTEASCED